MDPASVTVARFLSGALMLALILCCQGRGRDVWPRRAVAALGASPLRSPMATNSSRQQREPFVFSALVIATMTAGGPRPSLRAVTGALSALRASEFWL